MKTEPWGSVIKEEHTLTTHKQKQGFIQPAFFDP